MPIPKDEPQRLRDLYRYAILDTPPEEIFDNITRLAAQICGTPMALISLVDSGRQWFKAREGVSIRQTPRAIAFCAHAIMTEDLFVVTDARRDERFAHSPLVTGKPGIRFYAGAPLMTPDHHAIGTLCVLDRVPRDLTAGQREALNLLSHQVIIQLELRRRTRDLETSLADAREQLKHLRNRLNVAESHRQRPRG